MALVRKTTLEIDVTKLDKERFITYENKEGNTVKKMRVDLIETDQTKVITNKDGEPIQGDGWRIENVGFVVETPTKEERQEKKNTEIVGNATRIVNTDDNQAPKKDDYNPDAINPDDIPF